MKTIAALLATTVIACAAPAETSVEQSSTSNQYCGNPPYYTCQPGSVDNCASECMWSDQGTGYCPDYYAGEYFHCAAVGYERWTTGQWSGLWRCYAGSPVTPQRCISGFAP